jgi:hypothetical protein
LFEPSEQLKNVRICVKILECGHIAVEVGVSAVDCRFRGREIMPVATAAGTKSPWLLDAIPPAPP